tara:strand:- start:634 stop:1383 length:750 start_codon:yes stop_codon:yes gene_type:complete
MEKLIYNIFNKIFMYEVEKELLNYIGEEKNKIIFDVGCFRGNFTRNIIKHESKKGIQSNFFLFDPNPNVQNYLSSLLNENNVKCFNIAFDNSNNKKKFTLNEYFEASGSSLLSLHKEDKLYNLTRKSFMKIFQPFKKIKDYVEIDVKTQTIDNFCLQNKIDYIHLLKLDTEGNEFNILKGAENLLSENKIKVIYTEICSVKKDYNNKSLEIKNFLKKYNFQHIKSYKIPTLGFLSNLKATDDLFVFKKI